jgi:hypothetical protein
MLNLEIKPSEWASLVVKMAVSFIFDTYRMMEQSEVAQKEIGF